jgi:chloramphenicol-sensitive protein RarD
MPELGHALCSPRERRSLLAGGVLIAINWGVFIWAVGAGRVVETSLGYYLNPIVNVLLGTLFLRERLSRALNSNF